MDLDYLSAIDISIPSEHLKKVFEEIYGVNASPDLFEIDITEYTNEISMLLQKEAMDVDEIKSLLEAYGLTLSEWEEIYNQSIDFALQLMADPDKIENWNLSTGELMTPPPDIPGIGCEDSDGITVSSDNSGTCSGDGGANTSSGPGGDHPDDNASYSSGSVAATGISASDYTRLGLKKGQKGRLVFRKLRGIYEEYKNLPSDVPLEIRQQKFNALFDYYTSNINNWQAGEDIGKYNLSLARDTVNPSDIVILKKGYFNNARDLIEKYKEPVIVRSTKFSPQIVENRPVLIISSGGLYGLETSGFLKASLDEYVKEGGTLIVFAQQHGYEFSVLPVPQEADGTYKKVTGYGWREDQSCFANSAYIDTWHQMLAGQGRSTPTLNVDGYFTNFPSSATVLLRRTKNGQPAMIMYDYGLGRVIVTSMYTDWAYGHGQASKEEIALVRDMISWAKAPAQLPEITAGETASLEMSLANNSVSNATSAKLTVLDPDRNILSEQTVGVSLPAGQTATVSFAYTTAATSPLGIYHVDYTLLDASGNVIQPQAETDSGRFVVSSPPANPYVISGLRMSINASEQVLKGSDVPVTVTLWNFTPNDESFRLYDEWNHHLAKFLDEVLVPANGSITMNYIAHTPNYYGRGRYWIHVFNNNGVKLPTIMGYSGIPERRSYYAGSFGKGFVMVRPSAKPTVVTDKAVYSKGETVALGISVKNLFDIGYSYIVNTTVADVNNAVVFSDIRTLYLPAHASDSFTLGYPIPQSAAIGTYTVKTEVSVEGSTVSADVKKFELPASVISVSPDLPASFSTGTNIFSFVLDNNGQIPVSFGMLDVNLTDPEGVSLYSGSLPFALSVGENKVLKAPLNIPALKFGDYVLSYTQSDETGAGQPANIVIPNSAAITSVSFDKTSYRMRETASLTVDVANTGKFNLDNVSVTVSAPDAGYSDLRVIQLGINNATSLNYAIPIPETVTAGLHNVNIKLSLPSGSSVLQSNKFTIPESSLTVKYSGLTTVTSGDVINLTIENTGGVDTNYTSEELYIIDNKGIVIYNGSAAGSVLAGERKTLVDIQIPSQTAEGPVTILARINNGNTGELSNLTKTLEIAGLTADLQSSTDKDAYLKTEAITGISNITSGQFEIVNGNLNIAITGMKPAGTKVQYKQILKLPSWWDWLSGVAAGPEGSVYITTINQGYVFKYDNNDQYIRSWGLYTYCKGIAVGPDSSVYLIATSLGRIYKFDSDGNFITMWGNYGTGDSQFRSPSGIAVAPDGSVYVADMGNHRIQKFDSSGNFITKWGSLGAGNGQFDAPSSVAVASDGSVYVSDTFNSRIQKFNKDGVFVATWGSQGASDGQFDSPQGVAVDSDGSVYVSDTNNHRIQKFDSHGIFVAKWGSYGSGDGQFRYPSDVAVSPDGSIYVSDSLNNRVVKLVVSETSGAPGQIFETTIAINQAANTAKDYITDIGTLNTIGKLYLNAELKNDLGQLIAKDEYPFYIVDGNTLLLFSTDKKFYRPGEVVTITGEVRNLAAIAATGLTLSINQDTQALYTATFDVPAGGSQPFSAATTASAEGTYILTGSVTQNNSTLVEITDQYEVALPVVTATVTAPDVVGNEPFDITVEIKNDGKVDATVTLQSSIDGQVQDITIPAGEARILQYSEQITAAASYTFTFTGDLEQTVTKTVNYGLGASIAVSPQAVYPEGKVAIPVTLLNTGTLDEALSVEYSLAPSGIVESRAYYIPAGATVTDTLYYDLLEGEYTLTANSQLPNAASQAVFSVRKENNVQMTISVGMQVGGLIPAVVNLANSGYNGIDGSLKYALVDSSGAEAWSGEQAVTALLPGELRTVTFDINPSAIVPGDYTLNVSLVNNSGQVLTSQSAPLSILGPVSVLTQVPAYQTFQPGQAAEMTFMVKNTGNLEGAVELAFSAYDLMDSSQRAWLAAGEEKAFTFRFVLPDDLEEKDYFADYRLLDGDGSLITSGQVKYHLAGINITVNASLDKQNYLEGETAHLTLNVQSQTGVPLPLFARVNYAGYESEQAFTLSGSQSLTFDVPLTQITGEKLFYGIYHESGRSIHLNSLYVHEAGDVLTITTDKQVYNPGETVAVTVTSAQSETLTISALDYSNTVAFSGTALDSFTLPAEMTAGTYTVNATLTTDAGETFTETHPFDVAGIQVRVLECVNDKGKYARSDTITTQYTISSNTDIPATLKTWIVDPEGAYTPAGETGITLTSNENLLFTGQTALQTGIAGIHRLVYGIYKGNLLLVSGSEAFDVGDAVLLGLSTDKADYPTNTEPIIVTASMFGTAGADLELLIDDVPVQAQQVSLNGFASMDINLGIVEPGVHTLKGMLTAGGLKSTKQTGFIYGSTLPDLVVRGYKTGDIDRDNNLAFKFTVTNQGKTPADATTLAFYAGDALVETKPVRALAPDESEEITLILNVLGRAGTLVLKAVSDSDNAVVEFNEENNTGTLTLEIPEATLFTSTGKDTYRWREGLDISADITNLSTGPLSRYSLRTTIESSTGAVLFDETKPLGALSGTTAYNFITIWNVPNYTDEGLYSVNQRLLNPAGETVGAASTTVEIVASDFSLAFAPEAVRLKQGEQATFTGLIEPIGIFDASIALTVEGLPAGASYMLNPGELVPPGEIAFEVYTNELTEAGTHEIKIIGEGDTMVHEAPMTLDVEAFGLEAATTSAELMQLESATFDIDVVSLNGYEGEVALSVSNAPYGMKAWLDRSSVQVPDTVKLNILTSKYARPGTYEITVSGNDGLVTHKLAFTLDLKPNPSIAEGIMTAEGPGPRNEAWVRLLDRNINPALELMAFDTKYGAFATSADIDGDGYDEIVVSQGPGPKNRPILKVFRRDGSLMGEYRLCGPKYGLPIASGDFDGDWRDELVVGTGHGPENAPRITVLKYDGVGFVSTGIDFLAFQCSDDDDEVKCKEHKEYKEKKHKKGRHDDCDDEDYCEVECDDENHGINVAVGDVNGDNIPEIIAAPGPGDDSPAIVRVFRVDTSMGPGNWIVSETISEFLAFTEDEAERGDDDNGKEPEHDAEHEDHDDDEIEPAEYGANVAAGDIDGDGIDEIIVGTGPDPENRAIVKVFKADGTVVLVMLPYEGVKHLYGVYVAAVDMDGDLVDEIITGLGPGPKNQARVRVLRTDGSELASFLAYPEKTKYGVRVFRARPGLAAE